MDKSCRPGLAPPHPVLDPRTLGRPVHLLSAFASRLERELSEAVIAPLNRRYRAGFQLRDLAFVPQRASLTAPASEPRWHWLTTESGAVGFHLARPVLLGLLAYRYGLHDDEGAPRRVSDDEPVTASESRLAARLAQQFVESLTRCVAGLNPGSEPLLPAGQTAAQPAESTGVSSASGWTIQAELHEPRLGVAGSLGFRLDEAWMARILRDLSPQRERRAARRESTLPALRERLPLQLVARLVEQQVPLGDLLDIRVGDVIPVHLGAADVLVAQSRLFRAAVAEHKGKLCLTSFEDAE